MSNSVKNNLSIGEIFGNIASGIAGVYVFIILAIFPLYTHDMYFDILGARYVFFKIWAISLAVLLVALGLVYIFIDLHDHSFSDSVLKRFITAFHPSNIMKHLVITDFFMISMFVVCIISTIGSGFKTEAFFGNAGRYQGLECWIMYFISYFCITRTFRFKKFYLDFALIAGAFACIWAVLDFLLLDPFGFFRNVTGVQRLMFSSSVGNLNTLTNYTGMVFAIAVSMFAVEKNIIKTIFYAIMAIIAAVGSMAGISDNIILSFFMVYLLLPFFIFKNRRGFVRYLMIIDISMVALFVLWLLCKRPHNTGQISFCMQMIENKYIPFMFIPFTIIIAIITYVLYKMEPHYEVSVDSKLTPLDSVMPNFVMILYVVIVFVGFAFVIYAILDINVFKKHSFWASMPGYAEFVFNDNWGTHRGHNWRIAITNFINFDWFKKLFGYGPDTYLVVSERTFYEEMVNRYGEVYDSAHNEYLNYLICEGALGLISYVGMFISGIIVGVKNMKHNKYVLACFIPVACYMFQAVVNIAIPITTPIFFTLMYLAVASHFENKHLLNE